MPSPVLLPLPSPFFFALPLPLASPFLFSLRLPFSLKFVLAPTFRFSFGVVPLLASLWGSAASRLSLKLCHSSFLYWGPAGFLLPFVCAPLLFVSPCSAPLAHLPFSQQKLPMAILRSADLQAPKRQNWLAPARPPEESSTQWPPEERGKGRSPSPKRDCEGRRFF